MNAAVPVLIVLLSAGCIHYADHERHTLPEGFRGWVTIFFEVPDAPYLAREGSTRLYDIPLSGVLLVRDSINEGWGSHEYFFVDENGKRTPIIDEWTSNSPDSPQSQEVPTFVKQKTRTGGGSKLALEPPCVYLFQQYFIGTRAEALIAEPGDIVLDRLVDQLKPCNRRDDA